MGGFCKVLELAQGGCIINGAITQKLQGFSLNWCPLNSPSTKFLAKFLYLEKLSNSLLGILYLGEVLLSHPIDFAFKKKKLFQLII